MTYSCLLINNNYCYIFSSLLFLALTIAQVAHTIIYLLIYFAYLVWNPHHILLSRLHTYAKEGHLLSWSILLANCESQQSLALPSSTILHCQLCRMLTQGGVISCGSVICCSFYVSLRQRPGSPLSSCQASRWQMLDGKYSDEWCKPTVYPCRIRITCITWLLNMSYHFLGLILS